MSGLGVVGRDYFGVFPLRGKLLNVREAGASQLASNAEVSAIKQIMGLKSSGTYEDTKSLRYGHLMIVDDQVGQQPCFFLRLIVKKLTLIFKTRRTTMEVTSRG